MCFINEGRDVNEVEEEAIKEGFFGWDDYEMDFSKDGVILFLIFAGIPLFFTGSEAQGHFWQDARPLMDM